MYEGKIHPEEDYILESIYEANPHYNPGAYDRCLNCTYLLEKHCDGPNILAMTPKRRGEWLRALKQIRGLTIQDIADQAEVATATVERILSGDELKDIRVNTLARISFVLVGSAGQYPCALASADDSAYLAKTIAEKDVQISRMRETIDNIHESYAKELNAIRESYDTSYTRELQEVRADCKAKIDYLRAELEKKDRMIEQLISKL